MKLKFFIALLIIATAWGLVYFKNKKSLPNSEQAQEIKIGFIAPLTGSAASYGEETRNAALMAQEEINSQGGINGKKLNIIVEDGKCDASAALGAWQKLTETDKVNIILGGHCSTETVALAPKTAGKKVLLLANITSKSEIANEGTWVFRNSPPNSYYAEQAAKHAFSQGYKRMAVVTELKDYTKDFNQTFIKVYQDLGGVVVTEEQVTPDSTDFRTVMAKLKTGSFDAVQASFQGPATMGIFAKQMTEAGIDKPLLLDAAFNGKQFLSASGNQTPKVFYGITGYTDPIQPAAKIFVDNYKSKYNKDINFSLFYIAATYDMVYRLKNAIANCGSTETACIQSRFQKTEPISGAAGTITFDSLGRPRSPIAVATIVDGLAQYTLIK